MRKKAGVIIIFLLSILLYWSCQQSGPSETKVNQSAQYVGSQNCVSCHEQEFDLWKDSHHYQSMLLPNEESVLADFNTEVSIDGVSYTFFKSGDDY